MKNSTTDDLLDMMSEDTENSNLDESSMGRVAKLANQQRDLEAEINQITEKLVEKQKELEQISENEIPDLFDELGLSEIKLADGRKVTVERGFAASITEKTRPEAHGWLRANGHEALIKHSLSVNLKKGEEKEHKKILDVLNKLNLNYRDKEAVHPQTLKAFVREQMERKVNIPQNAFNVYPIRKTKIK